MAVTVRTAGVKTDPSFVQVIAQATAHDVSEVERRRLIGMMKGFRTFYRKEKGAEATVEHLNKKIREAEGLLR